MKTVVVIGGREQNMYSSLVTNN